MVLLWSPPTRLCGQKCKKVNFHSLNAELSAKSINTQEKSLPFSNRHSVKCAWASFKNYTVVIWPAGKILDFKLLYSLPQKGVF